MKTCLIFIFLLIIPSFATAQESDEERSFLTYEELIEELDKIATTYLEPSKILKEEFLSLQKTHGLSDHDQNYREFVRVRLAFELTRDSGLWQIRWAITDREPNSDSIWSQWNALSNPQYNTEASALPTAVAECDELSALFAFIARGMGVKKVGLFWPTSNHTVAVWTAKGTDGKLVRIIVPTSQIFISANASLGTNEFDPYKQKVIYDYGRKDTLPGHQIPMPVAKMMLLQAKTYGAEPASILQARRNRLSTKFGGS